MLLYQSVGTGKTCSAIAAATNNFEKQGYTILWVTRTTLKNDIWKNMFDQVCNESIRHQIENSGLKIPDEQDKRMRLLSKAWRIRPMSYKQFSNLVSKQNALYEMLVKINGKEDPLRKTLLIIDEAHKLYGGDDLSSLEKPDMNALHKALMYSYQFSGKDSVRVMLMTATPITKDPMELIQLVNLLKPANEQMPSDFSNFSEKYLSEEGKFTDVGRTQFLDDISGYISYLNRSKDARQFSQPQIHHVKAPIISDVTIAQRFDKKIVKDLLDTNVVELKQQVDEENKKLEESVHGINAKKFEFLKDNICGDITGKEKLNASK
jgi:superfamily II DNA or RNA helicase